MHKGLFIAALLLMIGLFSCRPYQEDVLSDVNIDLRDSLYRVIYDFQDRGLSDSLYQWLGHELPTYRYAAAMAFASIKDTAGIVPLAALLNDPIDDVRAAAAYAIGQTGAASAEALLIRAFDQMDTMGYYRKSNRAILEAIGKCGAVQSLQQISTVSTYLPKDTLLLEGQARSIYRFALRNMTVQEGTDRMVELATGSGFPGSVRQVAAAYLMRAQQIVLDSVACMPLIQQTLVEKDPYIRMSLVVALGKIGSTTARKTLMDLYTKETDYRVKVNILKAIGSFEYDAVKPMAFKALKDVNPHVSARAAQFFYEYGRASDAPVYWRLAKDSLHWSAQLTLYAATQRYLPAQSENRNAVNWELRKRYAEGITAYQKAAALQALAEFPWNFRFIQRESYQSADPAVRTAGVEALHRISSKPNFDKIFGANAKNTTREFAWYFRMAIDTGDPGMMAAAAIALRNPARNFKESLDSLDFMETALRKLSLPAATETYNELNRTWHFLQGKPEPAPLKPEFNHPIDWSVLDEFNMEPTAIIRTTKGNISIKLLPTLAPGTVVNFIRLAREAFFDGKYFHRVVPNFVIQGGCPRGDGYGSLDYSIRSELPPIAYDREGLVGMASAGNHTEGTQFFITHSPAFHLDGNYTIFARVIEGMEVVHQIQPGSKIERIIIQ